MWNGGFEIFDPIGAFRVELEAKILLKESFYIIFNKFLIEFL